MKYALFKIKEGKLEQWKNWCSKVRTDFYEEAHKTLIEENLFFEGFLIFEIDKQFYTLGYIQEKEGGSKPSNKNSSLNLEHLKNKKECLDFVSSGGTEYSLVL